MRNLVLGVHATLIAVVLLYYVASVTIYATPDANIGAALALLALGLAGLPWSWPLIDSTLQDTWRFFFPVAGAALLNLGLHRALWAWLLRGSDRRV